MKKIKQRFTVHYSLLIMMIIGGIFGFAKILLFYFLFLVLHEMVHAFFARKRGYALSKIKLTASGAVLEAEQDEFSYKDEIVIAISAPIFNLLVAFLIIAFWWIVPESYNFTQDIAVINLSIFAFNILPIFPLDGGRVLLAFLSQKIARKTAVYICKTISIIASILLFILFVISFFFSPLFAVGVASVNMFISAVAEDKQAIYKRNLYILRKLTRTKKQGVESREVYVHQSKSYMDLVKLVDARHFTTFMIVDDNFKTVQKIDEACLMKKMETTLATEKLSQIANEKTHLA